jgi:hypothetical protein
VANDRSAAIDLARRYRAFLRHPATLELLPQRFGPDAATLESVIEELLEGG